MRMCYFWAQNVLFVLKKNFMVQTIIITFIYLLALFKIAHLPQWEFFSQNLLIWLVPVIHAYLNAKNPSQILMIKEYWNLIGQEPFLALTWEPDFSQAWSFRRMLMNHKNFRLHRFLTRLMVRFSSKTPEACFWAIFDHFCSHLPHGDFPKKIRLCHSQLYMGP